MATCVYIDAHTHLYSDDFKKDLDDVIGRAKQNGVKAALVVSETPEDCARVLELADSHPDFCLPCFGAHPVQGDSSGEPRSVNNSDLETLTPWIDKYHERLVAIGEVGLDFTPRYCKNDEDKERQRNVLRKEVQLAKKYNLPLNVHSRSAGRPTINLLKQEGAEKVLLHAFDGRPSVAMEGVRAGYYFSIPPSIVRSEQKQKLVKQLPLENILLETDSPALGPEKMVRNEPSNIRLSCEYIAKIKGITADEVARITMENTLKLFPKIKHILKL